MSGLSAGDLAGKGFQMNIKWSDLDILRGLRIMIAAIVAFAVGGALGLPVITTAIGALIISLSDFKGPFFERIKSLCLFTILGALLTLGAGILGQSMWPMTVSTLIISFFCALCLVFGPRMAQFAMMLNMWYIIAQPYGSSELFLISPLCVVVAGAVVIVEISVLTAVRRGGHSPDLPPRDPEETKPDLHGLFSFDSPIFRFSLVKGCSIGFSALAGWVLIGAHPFWVTYSPITIIKPDLHQTVTTSIQRIAGTILGGIAGLVFTGFIHSDELILVIFFLGIFLMITVLNYNYTLFITLLTVVVVMAVEMAGAPFGITEVQRIAATVLGVAVTFVVIVILHFLMHKVRKDHKESSE